MQSWLHVFFLPSFQAIFQRYPRPDKEYQSFSLIYSDRSLDLVGISFYSLSSPNFQPFVSHARISYGISFVMTNVCSAHATMHPMSFLKYILIKYSHLTLNITDMQGQG